MRLMLLGFIWIGMAFGTGAGAQDLIYSSENTTSCLDAGTTDQEKKACIGVAANACMEDNQGGFSTYGMSVCLEQERSWWDGRLNAVYGVRRAADKAEDAQNVADGFAAPNKAHALRAMQRAWIAYRDTTCDYAGAQYGGGTGAGPATVGCLLTMTAEQTLFLETGPAY
jgi:uncharacterized protein YecT (DUF1311 family)